MTVHLTQVYPHWHAKHFHSWWKFDKVDKIEVYTDDLF